MMVKRSQGLTTRMSHSSDSSSEQSLATFDKFIQLANYSLLDNLHSDPESTKDGQDHHPRQVRSGHFVPVTPKRLEQPIYVSHSETLFTELGLDQDLAFNEEFKKLFSGDLSETREPMRPFGWATGYALSIYGTEYNQQCPFGNGNGYGDGRAISVFEGILKGQRWEMQLKGGGPTPYCRGADGRAVLRSSVREFLAQELMHALGVPTSRSLTLYASQIEKVRRPWYSENSNSSEPDILVEDPVAISTRVAPSFLRVGQLELFARRARNSGHPDVLNELRMIVLHLIDREYRSEINQTLDFSTQLVNLAGLYRERLTTLVAHWLRIGYCQGNFNSDNCLVAGRTMDYGPFGYVQKFEPYWNMWLGGGQHFGFLNQPLAGEKNFLVLANSVIELLDRKADKELMKTKFDSKHFKKIANAEMGEVWRKKLGLLKFDDTVSKLIKTILEVMEECEMDYTMFWWQLSMCTKFLNKFEDNNDSVNEEVLLEPLLPCFYNVNALNDIKRGHICKCIKDWLTIASNQNIKSSKEMNQLMRNNSPKYIPREWMFVNAYTEANEGSYTLVQELYELFKKPYRLTEYDGSNDQYFNKYYRKAPKCTYEGIGIGGEAYMT